MTSPASPKRTFEEAGLGDTEAENGISEQNHNIPQALSIPEGERPASTHLPLLPSIEAGAFTGSPFTSFIPPNSTTEKPAPKRVKLSAAEKEAKRAEKEEKERLRAEDKARKDEERAKKEVERKAKDEEKRKAREARDEQARFKEEEKQKKEDEKNKKARSQLRLNAFFPQPSNPNSSLTGSPTRADGPSPLSSRRSSIAEINAVESERRSRSVSVQATPTKAGLPEYNRCFPDFFVQSHTVLAPVNQFSGDEGLLHARAKIDEMLSMRLEEQLSSAQTFNAQTVLQLLPRKHQRAQRIVTLKEVVNKINGSSKNPIDLTDSASNHVKQQPTDMLKSIPIKFIKFAEDVRPPYIGTFSKLPKAGTIASLARNPFGRVRPDSNYDYDSEAEWEDLGEGEDLDSEGEEEEDDDEEADMDEFLDDEDTAAVKRRPLLGDQEPTCSGICWEGEQLSSNGLARPDLRPYRIDILLENPSFPIDPFSTSYWQSTSPNKSPAPRHSSNRITLMEPPRMPLHPLDKNNILLPIPSLSIETTLKASAKSNNTNKAPKAPKRYIAPDLLDEFKQAVQGSDLTKTGLVEILKKRFPKQPKDAIKETLDAVAERVGEKAADKKWVLRSGM